MASPLLYDLARKPVHIEEELDFVQKISKELFEKVDEVRQYAEEIDFEAIRHDIEGKVQNATDYVTSLDPRDVPPDVVMPIVAAVVFVVSLVILINFKREQRKRHREQYGENAFPPFAPCTMLETITSMAGTEQPWFLRQCAERVGPVFRLRVPFAQAPMFVAVGDVETAKEILQDPETTKPEALYTSMKSLAGGPNVVTSGGVHWKLSRKALAPAFMRSHLDRMHRVCKDQTERWIENRLETSIENGESFDVGEECMQLTLAIICRAAFEYRLKDQEALGLIKDLAAVSRDLAVDEIQSPLRKFMGSWLPWVREADAAKARIQNFAKKMLSAYRRQQKTRRQTTMPKTKDSKDSLISCIDKNMSYENDAHRIADIVMLLVSGHETTAYTLAWILLELAKNKKELLRLRNSLSGKDDMVAQQMLRDVLREGMRLHPVSPGVDVRVIGKDFYLKESAMVIPKGSHIMFPSIVMTRHGVNDAEKFRPSRWAAHPEKNFLTFSTGKRNCIGQSLALAEVTWVLSRLCAKYDFEVADEGKAEFSSTLKCVGAKLKANHLSRSYLDAQ